MQENLKTGTWRKQAWFLKLKTWLEGCRFPSRLGTSCFVKVPVLLWPRDHRECPWLSPLEYALLWTLTGCSRLYLSDAPKSSWTWKNKINDLNFKFFAYEKEWWTGKKGLFEDQITKGPGAEMKEGLSRVRIANNSVARQIRGTGGLDEALLGAFLHCMPQPDTKQSAHERLLPQWGQSEGLLSSSYFLMLCNHLNTNVR